MAQVLTTKEIAAALDNIIKDAEKYICIFTYNIKIDGIYLSRLRNAAKRGVKITIVFGVERGRPDIMLQLKHLPNCTIYFRPYLHAKFFYNEKQLLIGSMNLSEASEERNCELGALFSVGDDRELFKKVKAEAREIISDAQPLISEVFSVSSNKHNDEHSTQGHCIRCSSPINYNPLKPFCISCYTEWAEWENEYYTEVFCHLCGQRKSGISFARPECKSCYSLQLNQKERALKSAKQPSLDNIIKKVLEQNLGIKARSITIDFDLASYFVVEDNPKRKSILSELQNELQIDLNQGNSVINDYWDLYKFISERLTKKPV